LRHDTMTYLNNKQIYTYKRNLIRIHNDNNNVTNKNNNNLKF